MIMDPAECGLLRAKYLDWCSAQVADRFLRLTPDQIYELAEQASREGGGGREEPGRSDASLDPAAGGELPSAAWLYGAPRGNNSGNDAPPHARPGSRVEPTGTAGLSYRVLVERVTEALLARLRLPSFEEWVRAYRAEPERFEKELLGFWSTEAR
jgi:hypothetical protein